MRVSARCAATAAALLLAGCLTVDDARHLVNGSVTELASQPRRNDLHTAVGVIIYDALDGVLRFLTDHRVPIGNGVAELGHDLARALDGELGPAMARRAHDVAGAAVDGAVAALGPAPVDALGKSVAGALDHRVGPAVKTVLTRDVGSAVHTVITRDVGSAVKTVLADDVAPFFDDQKLTTSARSVGAGLADGVYTQLRSDVDRDPELQKLLARLRTDVVSFATAATAVGIVALLAGLGAFVAWLQWRQKRDHQDALELVTSSIKRLEQSDDVQALVDTIRHRRREPGGELLARFVAKRGYRVRPRSPR